MNELMEFRKAKDDFYAHDAESPLTEQQKQDFEGLHYFPENTELRFELSLEKLASPQEIQIPTSTGGFRSYQRLGIIRFQIEGQDAALTIYTDENGYFLPFVDSQAGKETYPAGRYLEPELLPNGKVWVDFNLAYNPYCAYNDTWTCPLTPPENRLIIPVRAGEKLFHAV
jgi:uncharacterized protein (DUF1684 family)